MGFSRQTLVQIDKTVARALAPSIVLLPNDLLRLSTSARRSLSARLLSQEILLGKQVNNLSLPALFSWALSLVSLSVSLKVNRYFLSITVFSPISFLYIS